MRVVVRNGLFVAECAYEEKDAAKAAGFRWHRLPCDWEKRGCKACKAKLGSKVWYTAETSAAAKLIDYADDEAKQALGAHTASVTASKATDFVGDLPCPDGLSYLPYQRAGIAYAVARKNVLIADEMGLGKTIQAIGRINAEIEPKSVLVLCPSSLRINWAREWKKWSVHHGFTPYVVESNDDIPSFANMVIVNYDKLGLRAQWQHVFKRIAEYIIAGITVDDGLNPYTDGHGMLRKTLFEQLMARKWDFLIADEAHYLKNPRTARSKLVLGAKGKKGQPSTPGLVQRADHFLCLTGTPILNSPSEIHPLLAALDPVVWGNFFAFGKRYCAGYQKWVGRKAVWDFSGASHLDELQEKLRATVMVRRLKADVLTDLPPKRRQIIPLAVNGAAEVVKTQLAKWDAHEDRVETLRARLELAEAGGDETEYSRVAKELSDETSVAFTEMAKERHAVAVKKIPAVIEHLHGLFEEGVQKIICFAHHQDVIKALVKEFGEEAVQLTGQTPMAERQDAVDRFQADPTCKLFVGNILAAGVGLTLTAASTVVFAELSWVPAEVSQAEDRAHRIGQLDSVLVQHLVFDGSLDARMVAFIIEKQAIADKALDKNAPKLELPVLPASAPALAKNGSQQPATRPTAKKWPEATPAEKDAAKFAMQLLAGVCDGAFQLDGQGFNKMDAHMGHDLARKPEMFTDGQVFLAKRLATKYRRQLPLDVLSSLNLTK